MYADKHFIDWAVVDSVRKTIIDRQPGEKFQLLDVVGELHRQGVPWITQQGTAMQNARMPAYEAANRILQKLRKQGYIKFVFNRWVRL